MRTDILRSLILLLIGLSASTPIASAADDDGAALLAIKEWVEPAEPMKIVGPIHFVGTRGLGVYLITSSEGHILLFGGMPQSGEAIDASIRKLGFKTEDIKLILTCHAHIDHVGTHAYFKDKSRAQVAMMAEEVELLQSGGKTDFHYASIPAFHFPPTIVDRVLRDGERVKLGDVSLTAHHTGGHTKGGTTWSMHVTEGGKTYFVVFPDGKRGRLPAQLSRARDAQARYLAALTHELLRFRKEARAGRERRSAGVD
jgi:glyoxylase-like metal-dependent hydrolase (beta-lactamase superfamily II)